MRRPRKLLNLYVAPDDAVVELAKLKVTVRCLPLEQSQTEGRCVVTGRPAIKDAIFAKAY